jgi:hypothetical protein
MRAPLFCWALKETMTTGQISLTLIRLAIVAGILTSVAAPTLAAENPQKPPPPAKDDGDDNSGDSGGKDSSGDDSKPTPPPQPTATSNGKPTPPPQPTATPSAKPTPPPKPDSDGPKPTAPPKPTTTPTRAKPTPPPKPTTTPEPSPTASPTPAPIIRGRVFEDADGDGQRDPGEGGVPGVAVQVDGQVVTATDESGCFSFGVTAGGRSAKLAVVPPAGWEWAGDPVAAIDALDSEVAFALSRIERPPQVTPLQAIGGSVALVASVGGLALMGFGMLMSAASERSRERTYRRLKSAELEHLQSEAVERRRREAGETLARPNGWRKILDQLLADSLPETGSRVGREGVLDLSVLPAPRFTVAGPDGRSYLFTTAPEALRKLRLVSRRDKVIPLDAAVHPAARVEAQAVWEHLVAERLKGSAPALPRRAEWFLVLRKKQRKGMRA